MKFHRLTQIFSRTRSAPLRYEECSGIGKKKILMVLFMPDVTGDEAMAWLKADPLTRNIPVIVTTAFLSGTLVGRAIAVGAAEVLYKPFHLKSLRVVMQRHLSVNHQTAAGPPIT